MDKHVALPVYLREGIRPLKRGFPQRIKLFTFDTETDYGEPYLLIFNDGNHVSTFKVDKNTVLDRFIGYLLKHCNSNKHTHILFCHNLSFDLPAVLTQVEHELFLRKNSTFRYLTDPETREAIAEIKLFTNKSWFAQISLKNNATIKVVDSANFLRGKLYDLSRALDLKYKKRNPPSCVMQGKRPRTKTEWAELYRYCFDESKAEYELAKYILNMHWQYDVTLSVSAPHLASKIFRKCFLTENIPQIPEHIRKLAESTIHGGRAEVFVNTPIPIPNVSMYDYNSFYPYSMANLPGLTKGEWKPVDGFDPDHEGFYYVSGYVKQCPYPIIIKSTSKMDYANDEQISNVPISSCELKEALSCNELELSKVFGYIWVPHADSKNPFKPYVEHFYAQKEKYPKNSPLNTQAKLALNSLYGKTYQALLDPESENLEDFKVLPNHRVAKIEKWYRAGGLYLPHVGAWITSQGRAMLHRDLHRYSGIDCATDSFKTTMSVPTGTELGALKKEVEGLLLLLRPKVYVMFSPKWQNEILQCGNLPAYLAKEMPKMKVGKDEAIIKFALHGFQGNVHTLLEMIAENKFTYEARHMVKIGEAIRQHKQPRVMELQKRTLNVDWQKLSDPYIKAQQCQNTTLL